MFVMLLQVVFMSGNTNSYKVYVDVTANYTRTGIITPISFVWEDGTKYMIDKVLDARRAVSAKAGGVGTRYTCKVRGKQVYVWLEDDKWFIERKEVK